MSAGAIQPAAIRTAAGPVAPPGPVTVIQPRTGWLRCDLAEIWQFRDLLKLLAWRDIQVRYKQTVLGAAWAVLQPLLSMVVFTVVFGRLLGLDRTVGSQPYPVFLYAGLLPWTFFAAALTASGNSLVSHANLLCKVRFPRLVLPLAAAGAPLLDLAVAVSVLLGLMLWFGIAWTWSLLLLPLMAAAAMLAALSLGLLLSALTVTYRDFRHVVPFLVQLGFFVTPVLAPASVVPPAYQWLLWLNPAGGPVAGFRAAALGLPMPWPALALSGGVSLLLLLAGLAYFGRTESRFADVV